MAETTNIPKYPIPKDKLDTVQDIEGVSMILNSAIVDLTNRNNEMLEGQYEEDKRQIGAVIGSNALLKARLILIEAVKDLNEALNEIYKS